MELDKPQRIRKNLTTVGKGSSAVVIPKDWLREMGCNEESYVFLEFHGNRIVIERAVVMNEGDTSSA